MAARTCPGVSFIFSDGVAAPSDFLAPFERVMRVLGGMSQSSRCWGELCEVGKGVRRVWE